MCVTNATEAYNSQDTGEWRKQQSAEAVTLFHALPMLA
jgi:hypothetical protein